MNPKFLRPLLMMAAAEAIASTATTPAAAAAKTADKPVETPKKEEPKLSAGDKAIAACKVAGATNAQLLKALWSTRGAIYAPVAGFDFPVAIVKSDLTGMLQAMPADDPAPFILTPRTGKDGGADLKAVAKTGDVKPADKGGAKPGAKK